MKSITFFLTLLISISVHADTIPTLSIYYNNLKIAGLNLAKGNEFTVSSQNYKPGDDFAIQYLDDMKCSGCHYEIVVVAEGKTEMMSKKFTNKNEIVEVELKKLFDHIDRFKIKDPVFVIYLYTTDRKGKKDNGPRLMTLHIK